MSLSQGKGVREGRRLPFFAITKPAMRALRASFKGSERRTAIAVYATCVEASNDEGADSFEAERGTLAARAGVHVSTLTAYADRLADAGLLRVERRREGALNIANRWTLTDPPEVLDDAGDDRPAKKRGPRATRGPSSSQTRTVLASDEDPSSPQTRTSSSETADVLASHEDPSSSQTRHVKERLEEQQAAKAAAPHASASAPTPAPGPTRATGTGSSSNGKNPDSSEYWDRAAAALVVAGFTPKETQGARLAVLERLRASHIPLDDIIWPLIGEPMATWRTDPGVNATDPAGVLAFALNQRGRVAYRHTNPPQPSGAPGGAPAAQVSPGRPDGLQIPDPTTDAAEAWAGVLDTIRKAENWADIERSCGALLESVQPLRIADNGTVLEITGPQDRIGWYGTQLGRLLDWATGTRGRVRIVARADAARQTRSAAA